MAEPPIKKGWLRKQARGGLVKNWQNRFFVLKRGKIAYYTKELEYAPYGDDLKVICFVVMEQFFVFKQFFRFVGRIASFGRKSL